MLSLHKQTVTVSKKELLEKLQENYNKYLLDFIEANKDYQDLIRSHAARLNEAISEGNFSDKEIIYFKVQPPANYTGKYLDIIEMLKYSIEDTVTLDTFAFKAYMKNEWDWTESFHSYARSLKVG